MELEGLLAVCVQHEIDHLDGKLFVDYLSILKRQQVNNRFPRYLGADVEVAHKTGDGQPWVANDAGILWVKGTPIVLVAFAGHHRGTTEEIHEAEARIAAIVADYFGGKVDASVIRPSQRR